MKKKSIAIAAMLCAVAYYMPAMADEMPDEGQMMQLSQNDVGMQNSNPDNSMNNPSPTDSMSSNSPNDMLSSNTNSSDDMGSPDTATGDDDY